MKKVSYNELDTLNAWEAEMVSRALEETAATQVYDQHSIDALIAKWQRISITHNNVVRFNLKP